MGLHSKNDKLFYIRDSDRNQAEFYRLRALLQKFKETQLTTGTFPKELLDEVDRDSHRLDKGPPVACVVYQFANDVITFGTSTHNPHDRFDRQRMIDIATARSAEPRQGNVIRTPAGVHPRQVERLIKLHILANPASFPNRLRNPLKACQLVWDSPEKTDVSATP